MEFGYVLEPSPRYTAKLAARVEALGFDIMLCPDTQNLCADPYSQLALAGAATRRLRLGTGVTNPVTRDAAVTASAVATLQLETDGRAICGLGRGDSSVAHIGRRSATTEELREYAERVRAYLSGGVLRVGGSDSRLRWVDPAKIPPAPIDIACTGPKTIEAAADVADRVSFAVGSANERIRWAHGVLRARLGATSRKPESLRVGAYVIVVCDRDERRAVQLARMISGLIAHFTAMKHAPVDHLPSRLKQLAMQLRTTYDMARHNLASGAHLPLVDDDFVRWFAICGPPALCIDRLGELKAMGLDHLYVLNGSPIDEPHGPKWEAAVNELELFASHVMPALRA